MILVGLQQQWKLLYNIMPIEAWVSLIFGWLNALYVEKYYVSRLALLPKVIAIFLLACEVDLSLPQYFWYYIVIGIVVGGMTSAAYFRKKRLSGRVYQAIHIIWRGWILMSIYTALLLYKHGVFA